MASTTTTPSGRPSSRSRAFLVGALVPLLVGEMTILTFFMIAASSVAPLKEAGPVATFLMLLPGTLLIGCLFAFPISAALVVSMTWLIRHNHYFDHLISWIIAGMLFSAPLSFLLWCFDASDVRWLLLLFGLILGATGGSSAGITRPQRRETKG